MSALVSVAAVVALALASIGLGGLALRGLTGRSLVLPPLDRWCLSFVAGYGILGWLLFFPGVAGHFFAPVFWASTAAGIGAFVLNRAWLPIEPRRPSASVLLAILIAVVALVGFVDLLEGIAPPADADTLSYQFGQPKDFLREGRIFFYERAIDGTSAKLVQMTYAAALAMGGELALTLWTMTTGWATSVLLFAALRRIVPELWSLAFTAAFLSAPAVLYGGGNGQVEIRCAAFALAAAMLIVEQRRSSAPGPIVAAGLFAGFFVGTKFFGLIFAGSACLVVLLRRGGLPRAAAFGCAAAAAGFQWYAWNFVHTGDPIFPALFGALGLPDTSYWTREFNLYSSKTYAAGELHLERSFLNYVLYPALASFNLVEKLEGGRTGLGVLAFVLLPLALAGATRREARRDEILVPLAIAFLFYSLWFFSGTTQRVRHLLPVYPLLLAALCPLAVEGARRIGATRGLAAGVGAVLAIQTCGQVVFGVNYAHYAFGSETREQFLARNVSGAEGVDWINRNLPPGATVATGTRELAYLFEIRSYVLHPYTQMQVDIRPDAGDDRRFAGQLRAQGITHLYATEGMLQRGSPRLEATPFHRMIDRLVDSGCIAVARRFESRHSPSRTLMQLGGGFQTVGYVLATVEFDRCPGNR